MRKKTFWISANATIGMHVQAENRDEAIQIAESHNNSSNQKDVDIFSIDGVEVDFCKEKGGA